MRLKPGIAKGTPMSLGQLPPTLTARDIMNTRLVTLRPEMDIFHGIEMLIKHRISGAPVVDSARQLRGVFSEKCVMRVLVDAAYDQLPNTTIEWFMDRSPHTIGEDTDLLAIAQIFLTTPRRRLPVLRGTELVGQISRRDVVRAVFEIMRKSASHEKVLLYLSALRSMGEAPSL
jgi:CBS domain-containing protein